jgi:hypothetical protein
MRFQNSEDVQIFRIVIRIDGWEGSPIMALDRRRLEANDAARQRTPPRDQPLSAHPFFSITRTSKVRLPSNELATRHTFSARSSNSFALT